MSKESLSNNYLVKLNKLNKSIKEYEESKIKIKFDVDLTHDTYKHKAYKSKYNYKASDFNISNKIHSPKKLNYSLTKKNENRVKQSYYKESYFKSIEKNDLTYEEDKEMRFIYNQKKLISKLESKIPLLTEDKRKSFNYNNSKSVSLVKVNSTEKNIVHIKTNTNKLLVDLKNKSSNLSNKTKTNLSELNLITTSQIPKDLKFTNHRKAASVIMNHGFDINKLHQLKKNKKQLPLIEYQQRLMELSKPSFSGENLRRLGSELRMIAISTNEDIHRKKNKGRWNETLKKISAYLPDYLVNLFEKF